MTSNDLADYLLNFIMTVEDYDESKHEKASTMLRQQQAEIERLNLVISNDTKYLNSDNEIMQKQQAEIEALEASKDRLIKTLLDVRGAEPVAYMSEVTLKHCLEGNEICVRQNDELDDDCTIPLYTHPVDEQDESFDRTASHMAGEYVSYQKELTDEEIFSIAIDCTYGGDLHADKFARAILRKAQEK